MEAQHRGLEYIPNVSRAVIGADGRAQRNSTKKGYLHGAALQQRVEKIVEEFTTDTKIRESMHKQQTQENEGTNRKYLTKSPKDRDYTGSSSYPTRISVAVNEVNRGGLETHTLFLERAGLTIGGWGARALQFLIDTARKSVARKATRGARAGRRHKKKTVSAEAAAKESEMSRDDYRSQAHSEGEHESRSKLNALMESIVARVDCGYGWRDGRWQDGEALLIEPAPATTKPASSTKKKAPKKQAVVAGGGGGAPKRQRRNAADVQAATTAAAKEAKSIDWAAAVKSRELEEGSRGKHTVALLKGYCTLHGIDFNTSARLPQLQRLVIEHVQKHNKNV
jgi:hypothetical protein